MSFPTNEEIAVQQAAIGRAYERYVAEHEDDVPFDPPAGNADEPQDYGEHHPIVSATPEQVAAFDALVAEEVRGVAGNGS